MAITALLYRADQALGAVFLRPASAGARGLWQFADIATRERVIIQRPTLARAARPRL
ncbi:MAG: hypothetical protein H0U97_22540 [Gammaproteobacteria bacterium]|nr:hypothetical protein [Gammaproteobacteria bacterium]